MSYGNRISAKEAQVLELILGGHDTGPRLAAKTGRSPQGCHQTAASLVRKGWAARQREAAVRYRVTGAGAVTLALVAKYPDLVQGSL